MAEQLDLTRAKAVFATACSTLDSNKWKYHRDDEELAIRCGVQGEDLPMELSIRVDAKRSVALMLSPMPFQIPEDKYLQMAVAVSVVNNRLVDGNFDFSLQNGALFFRVTNSFVDRELSEDVFGYMLAITCSTVDEYNDKFLMLSKGMLSLEQFIAAETN